MILQLKPATDLQECLTILVILVPFLLIYRPLRLSLLCVVVQLANALILLKQKLVLGTENYVSLAVSKIPSLTLEFNQMDFQIIATIPILLSLMSSQ